MLVYRLLAKLKVLFQWTNSFIIVLENEYDFTEISEKD